MSSEWRPVQISDVCDLIIDCVNKTAPRVEYVTPYKMIRTPNIRNGRVDLTDCRYVSYETYEKWTRRAKVEPGDVLLTREAPMGEVGIVDFDDTVFLGQRVMQYRVNKSIMLPRFLLYSFLSSNLQNQFRMHDGTGSVVSHIRVPDCSKFELMLPPLSEQHQIVAVLGSLDDKIQLNKQVNQTLEQMAQAIFKSWFVDFEPVKAKVAALEAGGSEEDALLAAMQAISGKDAAALIHLQTDQPDQYSELRTTAELFPSAMQDSELGEIPQGWSIESFSKIARLDTTSVKPSQDSKKVWEHYSIPAFDEGSAPVYDLGSEIKSNKYKVHPSAILSSKLNPHFPRTWVPALQNPDTAICSTEFMQFVPLELHQRAFIASLIKSEPFQNGIMMRVTGSTGSRQRAQPKQVATMDVVLPNNELRNAYSRRTQAMYDIHAKNIWQIRSLANLREALLPKLLSGELSVTHAVPEFAEAANN